MDILMYRRRYRSDTSWSAIADGLKWSVSDAGGTSTPVITKTTGAATAWEAYENGVLVATYDSNAPSHTFSAGSNNFWLMKLPDDDPVNVTLIEIRNDILTGSYPPEISHFASITYLDLRDNPGLSGDVSGFSALPLISSLRIFATSIGGQLSSLFGSSSLQNFYANASNVTGSLSGVAALTDLRQLQLHGSAGITLDGSSMPASIRNITVQDINATQAEVDDFINRLWADRNSFTYSSPSLNVGGNNSNPSGVYQYADPPATPLEKIYRLVNPSVPDGDAHNPWTITL
jgi:hypothetical protein